MIARTLILWLALSAVACGQDYGWPYTSVCRVSCPPYGGSGTLVAVNHDGEGLVLSAAHVFEGGDTSRISCTFPTLQERIPARVVDASREYDIAALVIRAPQLPTPRGIALPNREAGPFIAIGYPFDGGQRQRWVTGQVLGNRSAGEVLFSCVVKSGYSGGAIFDRYGNFCGVICGITNSGHRGPLDRTYAASGEYMLHFVNRFMGGQQ